MHTANLKPVERKSLTMSLQDRYAQTTSLPSGKGDAKRAGMPSPTSTDYVNTGDGEFRPLQYPTGIANDGRSVQVKSWGDHGGSGFLPTPKYAPSGRL